MNIPPSVQRRRPIADQSGFTLVEVLVAMAIFLVAVAGISHMNLRSVKNNDLSYTSTQLNAVLYEQMDTLASLPYDDNNLSEGAHPSVDFTERVPTRQQRLRPAMSWTVVNADAIVRGSKMIIGTIAWTQDGRPRQRDLRLLKVRNN